MNDESTPKEPEKMVACDICLKEIPESVANCMEGADYIHHFCGLDCYQKWQDTEKTAQKAVSQ